jgi:hypothetical protein
LICRFCSQWNPEQATRCCFCGNPADAVEDTTRAGRPSAAHQGLGPAKKTRRFGAGDARLARPERQLDRAKLIGKVVVGVALGLWLLFKLSGGCA